MLQPPRPLRLPALAAAAVAVAVVLMVAVLPGGVESSRAGNDAAAAAAAATPGPVWSVRYHLNTKTPYWTQGNFTRPTDPQCRPVHLNLLSRHGSREPTVKDVARLQALAARLHEHAAVIAQTDAALWWLRNFSSPFTNFTAGQLAQAGEMEGYLLAKRLQRQLPSIFDHFQDHYSLLYPIQTTQVPRAARTGNSFGYGLVERMGDIGPDDFEPFYQYSESRYLDDTLRFFDLCPRYQQWKEGKEGKRESKRWFARHMPAIAADITARLGLQRHWNLTDDDVATMWTACSYQVALTRNTGHFCSLFTERHARLIEYGNDLKTYWRKGPGRPINYQIAARLLQEVVALMEQVAASQDPSHPPQRAKIRFAHAETVMPFVALLGLFNDSQPLTADLPQAAIDDRRWRTSRIATFAANTMFILYNCSGDFRVKLLHNEREMPLPGCRGELYCPLAEVRRIYADALAIKLDSLCALDPTDADAAAAAAADAATTAATSQLPPLQQSAALFAAGILLGAALMWLLGARRGGSQQSHRATQQQRPKSQ